MKPTERINKNSSKEEKRKVLNYIEPSEATIDKLKGGKIKPIVGTKRGEKVRGDIVAEYMKKHGVKLGEASKKVKQLGLY